MAGTQVSFIPEAKQVLKILKQAREKETDKLYSLLLDVIREAAKRCCHTVHLTWLVSPHHADKGAILDKDGNRVGSVQFVIIYDSNRFDSLELAKRLEAEGFELTFHEYADLVGQVVSTISWREQ